MATPWKNVFVEVPADAQAVWIVRIPYFDTPVQALYSEGNHNFEWVNSNANIVEIDVNQVFKWRPL